MSSPTITGHGVFKAIKTCLQESGIRNNEIDVINSHATGTIVGDTSEARSLKMILGTPHDKLMRSTMDEIYAQNDDDLDKKNIKKPVIGASKGNTGHTCLAAGAIECMFAAKQFEENVIPKILNLENPVEPLLNYAQNENVKKDIKVMIKTGIGMGGNSSTIIFKRFEQ